MTEHEEWLRRAEADATYVRKDVYTAEQRLSDAKLEKVTKDVDLLYDKKRKVQALFWGAVASFAVGVGLLIVGLLVNTK